MANQPRAIDGNESVSAAAEVVDTDLGEDGEAAGDACLMRCHFALGAATAPFKNSMIALPPCTG